MQGEFPCQGPSEEPYNHPEPDESGPAIGCTVLGTDAEPIPECCDQEVRCPFNR